MKTQDFIEENLYATDYKKRTCSSVFTNGNGKFYSYGYHYPLITRINKKFYINDKGYSISTAKHIGWAHSAVRYEGFVYNDSYSTDVKKAAQMELKECKKRLPLLRKGAFRKEEQLRYRIAQLKETISSL